MNDVPNEKCPRCNSDNTEFLKELRVFDDYQNVKQRQYFCNDCNLLFATDESRIDKPPFETFR